MTIRPARDSDGEGMKELMRDIFAEYPGVFFVEEEFPDLNEVATYHESNGGKYWVVENAGEIIGGIGYTKAGEVVELKKLYVAATARKNGLGTKLCNLVLDAAKLHKATSIELWSDVKFKDAHRLYQKLGFRKLPDTRELHDKSDTVEYHFEMAL